METTSRTGENWQAFLAEFRILDITDSGGVYQVKSASGHTYTVRIHTKIDRDCGSMYFTWSCDCPARKTCRHIEAVRQMRWAESAAEENSDGMDIMEREI